MNVAFPIFEKKASTMYNMISRSQDSTGSSVTIFFENGPLTYFQALFHTVKSAAIFEPECL